MPSSRIAAILYAIMAPGFLVIAASNWARGERDRAGFNVLWALACALVFTFRKWWVR